jgi:pimeloyl-ACP methyl ester carboxylesterase
MPLPPLPELDGVEHRFETVNGVRLHYAEAGAGEPVLLQHGWPQHWWMWRDFIAPLAERFRVIVPDLRGHGWSDKPARGYRKAELLDDLIALLDRLEIDRVRWVGHDWGAWVGMLAALQRPERVEQLVAMAIPHPWQRTLPPPRVLLTGTYQLVLGGPLGRQAMQRPRFLRLMLRKGRSRGSFSPAEIATYAAIQHRPETARATVQLYRSFLLHELRPFAGGQFDSERLTVPTLWLVGGDDPLARHADDGYRDHADDMTLECIPGTNHFLPEEIPDAALRRISAFLGGQVPTRTDD